MKKIIGLNALFLIPNEVGGTEYHARSIIHELKAQDNKNQYVIFCNKENYHTFGSLGKQWKVVLCPINGRSRLSRILYEQFILPMQIMLNKCDIIHSFGYFGPLLSLNYKKIITVHDTNWIDHPENFTFLERLILSFIIPLNIIFSEKIITVSNFSKKTILKHFPQTKNKLIVIKNAVDDKLLKKINNSNKPPIRGKFILSVGAFYPHKKVPYLLDVWKNVQERQKNLKLVLIGQNGKDESLVKKKVGNLPSVIWKKKVSLEDLSLFYKHASLFISTSTYEGFGIPVYEALAAGLPILVGNKDLYDKKVVPHLKKINFDLKNDVKLVISMIKNNSRKESITLTSYSKEVKKLINIYNKI
jgi:glycosyltransferase involved in cell wall biosynthesis